MKLYVVLIETKCADIHVELRETLEQALITARNLAIELKDYEDNIVESIIDDPYSSGKIYCFQYFNGGVEVLEREVGKAYKI